MPLLTLRTTLWRADSSSIQRCILLLLYIARTKTVITLLTIGRKYTEQKMITVTEKAVEMIQDALKEKGDNPAVRVYIAGMG